VSGFTRRLIFSCRGVTLTDKRKFWSELSKRDEQFERKWIPWIELAAGFTAMSVLTLSFLAAVCGGKS
jgi:hypothetical protein